MPSLIVFTKFAETDNSIDVEFIANGQRFVFSPRKDNRMMYLDNDTANELAKNYPGNFTIWASYEGQGTQPVQDRKEAARAAVRSIHRGTD